MSDGSKKKDDAVQQAMTAFAEQLGWFLGTVRSNVDGLLENEQLVKQVSRIRDGATDLLSRVKQAGDVAKEAAVKAGAKPAKPAAKPAAQPAAKAPAPTKRQGREVERSGGAVDAPGKRHRKPPPQETANKRMGEVQGKKAGQKQFKVGKSRGRG
jgi:uncharacterized membrane protein